MSAHVPGHPFDSSDQGFTTRFGGEWMVRAFTIQTHPLPLPNPDPFYPMLIFASVGAAVMPSIWGLLFLLTSSSSWPHNKTSPITSS